MIALGSIIGAQAGSKFADMIPPVGLSYLFGLEFKMPLSHPKKRMETYELIIHMKYSIETAMGGYIEENEICLNNEPFRSGFRLR